MNVLITGVSSGLGAALADVYAKQGATVFGCSRRAPSEQSRYNFLSIDLSNATELRQRVPLLVGTETTIDLVILNAGILGEVEDLQNLSVEQVKATLDINLWSNKLLIDSLFEGTAQIRQVVAISSGASVNGNRGWAGYSISKAALNMMIKLYAAEHTDTHWASIAPGIFESEIQQAISKRDDDLRFTSMQNLKRIRSDGELPTAEAAAEKLAALFSELPQRLPSGEYGDLRTLTAS